MEKRCCFTKSDMPLIEVQKIKKTYDTGGVPFQALAGVDVSIETGEFVAIIGPSGSGKSTLMHILGFLDVPTSGKYKFDGKVLKDLDEETLAGIRNREIGFIFQMFHLLPRMSALDNVRLPMVYAGLSEEEQIKRATGALERVGLGDKLANEPNQMSGGQQQRVAIARALVNDPRIIMADEPTGNLDTKSSKEIMTILHDLHKEGRTVILITHDPKVAKTAERILKIVDGKIVSDTKS